jgi:hypothetical protein
MRADCLVLRDKTRAEQDDTSSHFDPCQVVASGPVEAPEYPTKLGKKIMAALDSIPNVAYARLA